MSNAQISMQAKKKTKNKQTKKQNETMQTYVNPFVT